VVVDGEDGASSAEPHADGRPDGEDGGGVGAGDLPEVAVAAASPLAPPSARQDLAPHPGDSAAAPSAVTHTAPGPHLRLLDDQGSEVDPDDLFLPQSGPSTLLTVKRRVYQEFRYPGTRTPVRQLLLNGGVTVPIPRAMQMIDEIKAVMAESAAKAQPVEPEQAAV
jgi:hypothetical protein